MLTEDITLTNFIISVSLIVGGFIVGVVLEKVILARLRKFAKRTSWEGDEITINSIKGAGILWFGLAGIYAAFANLPLKPVIQTVVNKSLLIVILISATVVLSKVVVGFISLHSKKATGGLPSASLFINVSRGVVFLLGALIILQSVGVSITPLITALGVGGLAVALALQPTLSNLFAGVQIIVSKQLEPGDWVEIDSGAKGYVVDVSWRNTTIRELPNNLIIVPNSLLANSVITNFSRPQKQMSVIIEVGVSYDSDLAKVERVTIDVAKKVVKEVQGGEAEFEPILRFHTFADFSINFSVIVRVKEYINKYLVRHEFIKALHKRYNEEGIEIPFPIRTVHMKDTKH
ncbi:MAG: mechanosensitive ion channel family protein [candidate division WOR-3 bacterium]|nr:mechanosensitive ion channel family protein [candidate division WOR-3 bacterium]